MNEGGNQATQPNLREVKDQANAHLLVDAYDARLVQVGGRAAMLDAIIEIAQTHGYHGTMEMATRLLQVEGFTVEAGPSGRGVVWRKATNGS